MDFTNRIRHFFGPDGGVKKPEAAPMPLLTPAVPATALEERQQLLAHHVRLVARGMSNGLCVYGSRGGLGKTKVILETLRQERVRPLVLNGHCTPLSLYTNLYHKSDAIVFLDDCDSLFRVLPALGILRSALWSGNSERRLVTYNSSQLKIPSSFYFTGRIIFTANTLPKRNHAFDAVLSRVDQFELNASNEEVLDMMRHLAKQGYGDTLYPPECAEVVDFIAGFAATRELSLRLLVPSYLKVVYARESNGAVDWRDLVRSQLEEIGQDISQADKLHEMDCLRQVIKVHADSVAEQVEAWCKETKRSRATFFRLKGRLQHEKKDEGQ